MFQIRRRGEVRKRPIAIFAEQNAPQEFAESSVPGFTLHAAGLVGFVDDRQSDVAPPKRRGEHFDPALLLGLDRDNPPHQVSLLAPGVQDATLAARFQVVTPFGQRDRLLPGLHQDRLAAAGKEFPDGVEHAPGGDLTLQLCFRSHDRFIPLTTRETTAATASWKGPAGKTARAEGAASLGTAILPRNQRSSTPTGSTPRQASFEPSRESQRAVRTREASRAGSSLSPGAKKTSPGDPSPGLVREIQSRTGGNPTKAE